MLSSLSVQKMYLSDDPEDWTWVRWYWCQPDAQPLALWTAYGSPVWEDWRNPVPAPPHIPLQPAKYFPSRVSPYPGQSYHGLPEWFEFGLPLDQRERVEAAEHCGAMRWDPDTGFVVDAEGSSMEPFVPVDSLGGDVDDGTAQIGPLSPEIVGLGAAFYSLPLFSQYVSYPPGQVGDLLLMMTYAFLGPGDPWVPDTWTLVGYSAETASGRRATVSYKFRTSAGFENEVYPTDDGLHFGWVCCLRGAGRPYECETLIGEGEIGTFPSVDVPPIIASTVMRFLYRAAVFPLTQSTPDGTTPWPGVVTGPTDPPTFLEYDQIEAASAKLSTWAGSRAWATSVTSIPPPNVLIGEGGDVDGGVAEQHGGYEWTAAGGDVDGGVAAQADGYHVLGTEGDVDGGEAEEWDVMYPGEIRAFGSLIPSSGWIECDGSAVSRTTFAALFSAISTTWGAGNGSTTFNVPDLRGRVPVGVGTGSGLTARAAGDTGGVETHTLVTGEMPGHAHTLTPDVAIDGIAGGATPARDVGTLATRNITVPGCATTSVGGDGAHENMQPFACVSWAIKT